MNMEHDEIMEEKLELLSDRLEEIVIDVFLAVLVRLKERSDLILSPVKEEDVPF